MRLLLGPLNLSSGSAFLPYRICVVFPGIAHPIDSLTVPLGSGFRGELSSSLDLVPEDQICCEGFFDGARKRADRPLEESTSPDQSILAR
jgi:hypothetical protein